uniref:Uncharacterized protein n=1 Tax=Anopheles dirus TaxID=7168 RepID=A0A182NVV3_9DIPT
MLSPTTDVQAIISCVNNREWRTQEPVRPVIAVPGPSRIGKYKLYPSKVVPSVVGVMFRVLFCVLTAFALQIQRMEHQ